MKDKNYFEEWLNYDKETGEFTWKKARGTKKPGDRAGSFNENGYRRVKLKGKEFRLHRLAWLFEFGEWPDGDLDHINRIPDDNRIENLRMATRSQNLMNISKHTDNISGYKGVSWHSKTATWRARICKNYNHLSLGYFDDVNEAATAYKKAAKIMFGEYNYEDTR